MKFAMLSGGVTDCIELFIVINICAIPILTINKSIFRLCEKSNISMYHFE